MKAFPLDRKLFKQKMMNLAEEIKQNTCPHLGGFARINFNEAPKEDEVDVSSVPEEFDNLPFVCPQCQTSGGFEKKEVVEGQSFLCDGGCNEKELEVGKKFFLCCCHQHLLCKMCSDLPCHWGLQFNRQKSLRCDKSRLIHRIPIPMRKSMFVVLTTSNGFLVTLAAR